MGYNVVVAGATGNVGREMLNILAEREFPVDELAALASRRSLGTEVSFGDKTLKTQDLEQFDFAGWDIALFAIGSDATKTYAPKAAAAGCVVIDNSSLYRYDPDVPLVVPEVNAEAVDGYAKKNIIANPNCSTIQMVLPLAPLHAEYGIKRIVVSTYQSVTGTGKNAVDQMMNERAGKEGEMAYPYKIDMNVLPNIDVFQDNGYTKEEMKMVWETRKILGDDDILVNPTAVRIPAFFGHSEAVHIETRDKISAAEVVALLAAAPGIEVLDGVATGEYPTAVTESSGNDPVYVGRIREDISHERGINLWVVADNIRKGAALNSVQIAEILAKNHL